MGNHCVRKMGDACLLFIVDYKNRLKGDFNYILIDE